jgi:hypothetical protein
MFDGPLGLPHARDASGTAWQPDSTPMHGVHQMSGDWMFMVHGLAFAGYDFQATRRGGDQWLSANWGMLMAERDLGKGQLTLRGMLSLDPATIGRDGYPLLLQSGESLGGRPLHDVQHPHDLFMELAADYRQPLSDDVGLELYLAPAGEPALGPAGFPHRLSSMSNPFAPLGHHWIDSTHVSFGVLTAGVYTRSAKLEASWFNGREPDENRWDFDFRALDSYSGRLSLNPTERWSLQISAGHLKSPEALEPDASETRVTASVTHNLPFADSGNWATTAAWGRKFVQGEPASSAFLVESNLELDRHHTPFARLEFVRKSAHDLALGDAFGHHTFGVGTLTLGYLYAFDPFGPVVPAVGAAVSGDLLDRDLEPAYGHRTAYGFMLFVRVSTPSL